MTSIAGGSHSLDGTMAPTLANSRVDSDKILPGFKWYWEITRQIKLVLRSPDLVSGDRYLSEKIGEKEIRK